MAVLAIAFITLSFLLYFTAFTENHLGFALLSALALISGFIFMFFSDPQSTTFSDFALGIVLGYVIYGVVGVATVLVWEVIE